ncbi:hypothetical protein [Lichenifustis flavocetrariae]|uniref:Lipocalin-like protein n=1 Tax=Lichenifustis flavocetrariae TaxID=2949735 RepID=A0AA42CJD6_9HYPH|nr:hypothetical protein [Lichenifustis flavocetrariae]MCW6509468.1 hypothetical protein [Lichenifustis flavocetrariae]
MSAMIVRTLSAGCLAALACLAQSASAQAAGPFANLPGAWSGGGTISMTDGHNERIRCKAVYEVASGGLALHQGLRCASDSYKFEITSNLQAENGQLSGTWSEETRQVTGDVTGQVNGNDISTFVSGLGFSARLNVTTRGNAQAVSITPEGTDIRAVRIELRRH